MENFESREILSKEVRAGKRTYFFDVKVTKNDEKYLTITESRRKFDTNTGNLFYEKHKIFIYKEDYAKFQNALESVLTFIETGVLPENPAFDEEYKKYDINFDDMEA